MTSPVVYARRLPGRPRRCPYDVLVLVVELRSSGARLIDICDRLNVAEIPTPGGGAYWWPSHVHRLLQTRDGIQFLDNARGEMELDSDHRRDLQAGGKGVRGT